MKTKTPLAERFWAKVNLTGDCWIWTASHNASGYGSFRTPEGSVLAHRFAYQLMVGPIPDGDTLDHLCRVRDCVRPEHLEPVSLEENLRRAGRLNDTTCRAGLHSWVAGSERCLECEAIYIRRRGVCECGREIALNNIGAHRKTNAHRRGMFDQRQAALSQVARR